MLTTEAPPIGLRPRWLVVEARMEEIRQAMTRYVNANTAIPPEWLQEYRELRSWLRVHRGEEFVIEVTVVEIPVLFLTH